MNAAVHRSRAECATALAAADLTSDKIPVGPRAARSSTLPADGQHGSLPPERNDPRASPSGPGTAAASVALAGLCLRGDESAATLRISLARDLARRTPVFAPRVSHPEPCWNRMTQNSPGVRHGWRPDALGCPTSRQ